MSGICGVIGLDGRPWSASHLGGVIESMSPLGRDDGGTWAGAAGRCGVAVAAALRRATPEDAFDRQPAKSDDGSLVLVADLRLDNRDELAAALGLQIGRHVPDSTLVLAAYGRWREAFLDRIVGEFALAIVDRERGGVLLARDHVGVRPLVVHERPGVVAFASTALALTGFEGVGRTLDVRRAAEVLAFVFATERTFVEGVRSFPPASALWIDSSGAKQWAWWRPEPDEIVDASPAVHERELRDALERAVAARLRTTGAIGATLSGGLDSTSVAATASRLLRPDRLLTYTSAPPPGWHGSERPGWDSDESALVQALARMHPNLDPHFVHVHPGESLFDLHQPLWEFGAAPTLHPCNVLWLHRIWTRAASEGVTALLTGSRGNLCFSADGPQWLVSLLRARRLASAWREAAAWGKVCGVGTSRALARYGVFPLFPAPVQRLARAVVGRRRDGPREWDGMAALRRKARAGLDLPAHLAVAATEWRQAAAPMLLAGSGHAEAEAARAALTGVEERDPTIDRRVLDVALRQPEWVRRRDGVTRAVVRGAMADRLPAEIVWRTRRGEQLPDWFDVLGAARAELASELEALAAHRASRELIDTERLQGLLAHWPDSGASADPKVVRDYRFALLRALVVSRYMRWFEQRTRSGGTRTRVRALDAHA